MCITHSAAGAPVATYRSAPAPTEPCIRIRSPARPYSIGTTHGLPSATVLSVPT